MELKKYPLCSDCESPVAGAPHTPKICVEMLKWKLSESERERRIAEGTMEWLKKNPENVRAL